MSTKPMVDKHDTLHTASIMFVPESKRQEKRFQLLRHDGHASQSEWIWAVDPRYFQQAPWQDWRGKPGERRNLIDLALRNVLSALGRYHEAVMMHASVVILNDKAYVAPGQSGRGKTTFFNLLGGYASGHLHEDLAFILDSRVFALPCRSSSTTWDMPVPNSADLESFVSLGRSDELRVTSVRESHKKLEIAMTACVFPLEKWSEDDAEYAFSTVMGLATKHRALRATFPLQTSQEALRNALISQLD